MAEKRGQYQYNDDGTISQLVGGDINLDGSNAAIPVDIQARYAESIQTHNAVVNPSAAASSFIPCEKFSELVCHMNVAGTILVEWSVDGTAVVSDETFTSVKIARVKGAAPFVRVKITATGTVTAYAYLLA